ncbi:hypothetical protein EJB05_00204 [Eragrostis curvula]|uniref:Uncharacterized protein n=1 Tax=Eragrostis curvula TaxID=38414 RepID=A0A5J9WNF5_9POAL|nr:hypothetical protein EJB05_00204 [Eragrostis curvula]
MIGSCSSTPALSKYREDEEDRLVSSDGWHREERRPPGHIQESLGMLQKTPACHSPEKACQKNGWSGMLRDELASENRANQLTPGNSLSSVSLQLYVCDRGERVTVRLGENGDESPSARPSDHERRGWESRFSADMTMPWRRSSREMARWDRECTAAVLLLGHCLLDHKTNKNMESSTSD